MGDLAGHVVADKWELVSILGTGSFADVWLVRHNVTHKSKALKLLHPQHAGSAETAQRFVREAQAASRIESPHVVSIDDIGRDEQLGRAYLVMELLRGRSLFDHLVLPPYALTAAETASVLRQVAAALDAAHAAGVVHRDLKPENIYLSWRTDGSVMVKVLDFGIAKLTGIQTNPPPGREGAGLRRLQTAGFVGTPGYASPEQITDSSNVSSASDLFSLGVCVYEMLTGSTYWRATDVSEMLAEIWQGPLEPPSARATNVELPAQFDAWFMKACARGASERFSSALEASREFERAMGLSDPLPFPPARGDVPSIPEDLTARISALPSDPGLTALRSRPDATRETASRSVFPPPPEADKRRASIRTPPPIELIPRGSDDGPEISLGSRSRRAAVAVIAGLVVVASIGLMLMRSSTPSGDRGASRQAARAVPEQAATPTATARTVVAPSEPTTATAPADAPRLAPTVTPSVIVTAAPVTPAAAVPQQPATQEGTSRRSRRRGASPTATPSNEPYEPHGL